MRAALGLLLAALSAAAGGGGGGGPRRFSLLVRPSSLVATSRRIAVANCLDLPCLAREAKRQLGLDGPEHELGRRVVLTPAVIDETLDKIPYDSLDEIDDVAKVQLWPVDAPPACTQLIDAERHAVLHEQREIVRAAEAQAAAAEGRAAEAERAAQELVATVDRLREQHDGSTCPAELKEAEQLAQACKSKAELLESKLTGAEEKNARLRAELEVERTSRAAAAAAGACEHEAKVIAALQAQQASDEEALDSLRTKLAGCETCSAALEARESELQSQQQESQALREQLADAAAAAGRHQSELAAATASAKEAAEDSCVCLQEECPECPEPPKPTCPEVVCPEAQCPECAECDCPETRCPEIQCPECAVCKCEECPECAACDAPQPGQGGDSGAWEATATTAATAASDLAAQVQGEWTSLRDMMRDMRASAEEDTGSHAPAPPEPPSESPWAAAAGFFSTLQTSGPLAASVGAVSGAVGQGFAVRAAMALGGALLLALLWQFQEQLAALLPDGAGDGAANLPDVPAFDEAAERAKLQKLRKMKELKQQALQCGVSETDLDDADDAQDAKAAVIDLIVAQAHAQFVQQAQADARRRREGEAAERAKLQKVRKMRELKQRARDCGVTDAQLGDADDAQDVKAAVIDLIMARRGHGLSEGVPPGGHRQAEPEPEPEFQLEPEPEPEAAQPADATPWTLARRIKATALIAALLGMALFGEPWHVLVLAAIGAALQMVRRAFGRLFASFSSSSEEGQAADAAERLQDIGDALQESGWEGELEKLSRGRFQSPAKAKISDLLSQIQESASPSPRSPGSEGSPRRDRSPRSSRSPGSRGNSPQRGAGAEESTFEDVFLESTEEQGKQQVRLVLSASHLTLIPVAGAQQQDEPQRHPLCDFLHPTPGGGSGGVLSWGPGTPEFIETELFLARGEEPLPLKLVFGAEGSGSGRAADRDRVLQAMQAQQRKDSKDSTRAALFTAAPSEPAEVLSRTPSGREFNPLSLQKQAPSPFDRFHKGIMAIDPGQTGGLGVINQQDSGSLTALCAGDQMLEGVHYLEFNLTQAGFESGVQLCLSRPGFDPTSRFGKSCVTETSSGMGYCTKDGRLRCNASNRQWTDPSGPTVQGAVTGDTVGLLLDLEQNTLAVYHQDRASWDDTAGSALPAARCVGKAKCV